MLFEKGSGSSRASTWRWPPCEEDGTLAEHRAAVALRRRRACPSCSDRPGPRRAWRRAPASVERRRCGAASAPGRCWSPRRGGRGLRRASASPSSSSPGWPTRPGDVLRLATHAKASFPAILEGFWLNVQMFLIAEPLILVLGLAVAAGPQVSAPPLLVPLRVLAVVYTDVFRGIPTILLVFLFALRRAGAAAAGRHHSRCSGWAPSRWCSPTAPTSPRCSAPASSRSTPPRSPAPTALGLSRGQTMRHVVVPQAVRRVVPPLLNDFVSLQKDTALVAVGRRLRRAVRGPRLRQLQLQLHAVRRGGGALRRADGAAGPAHRLARRAVHASGERAGPDEPDRRPARAARCEGLRKSYGDRVVLDDVDLTVARARRGLPDRRLRVGQVDAAALPRTCSRTSTTASSASRAARSPTRGSTRARCAAGSGWSSRPTTCSRT